MQIFFNEDIRKRLISANLMIIGLHGDGREIKPTRIKKGNKSEILYPVVMDDSVWTDEKQIESAEKWKDQIKRVFYPESVPPEKAIMLQDDLRRIQITQKLNFGERVLEFGCSDGTISMHIAKNIKVTEVVGVDIRRSAIEDAKKLKDELLKNNFLNDKEAEKLRFVLLNGSLNEKMFASDTVCAFEVLEHIHPSNMLEIFNALYRALKYNGNMFISVPNRYPNEKYTKEGRHRWPWYDHKNFFSKLSLELFLKEYFSEVRFFPLYDNEEPHESIYLICECRGKKR